MLSRGGGIKARFKGTSKEGKAFVMVLWEKVAFFLELGCHLFSTLVQSFSIRLGSRINHLGAHRHSYCYSEMVMRHRGPFVPLSKLNQLMQVTVLFLRCEHSQRVWLCVVFCGFTGGRSRGMVLGQWC